MNGLTTQVGMVVAPGGGGGGFSPLDLSPDLWLDASVASSLWDATSGGINVVSGGNVYRWEDLSGHARHGLVVDSPPTYTAADANANSKPSVGRLLVDDKHGVVTPSLTAAEIYIVAAHPASTFEGYESLLSGPGSSGNYRHMGHSSQQKWYDGSGVIDSIPYVNGVASASPTVVLPLPLSIVRLLAANGTSPPSITQAWGIGHNRSTVDRTWKGPICEVLMFSSELSELGRADLDTYLQAKWGI